MLGSYGGFSACLAGGSRHRCGCGCQLQRIGEDVSEKLDYTPGLFTVEQHVRGKWACRQCETLIQAPVPAQVIEKGIPTAGLLAHVMVAKFSDHLPLYRQEKIFGRAGLAIPRSTLAQWVGQTGVQLQPLVDALREAVLAQRVVHADETPVQMLAPGEKKTHRAYVWAYLAILHGAHRSQNACDGRSASPSRHLTMLSPVLICGRNSSSINSLNFLCVHIGLRLQPVSESGTPGSAMVGGQRANAVGVPASRTLTKGNSQCRSLQLLARHALAVRWEMNNLNFVLCL